MICRGLLTAFLIAFVITSSARAQTPLAQVIPTLLGPDMLIAPGPGGTHARDFALDFGEVGVVVGPFGSYLSGPRGSDFSRAIVDQITTFPIGSSSGGFLYGFDPSLGTFTRSTRSFGPSYTERPQTSGRGTVSIGFTAQSVEYDRFDGASLDGDDIRFYYVHRNLTNVCSSAISCTPTSPELSDVMEATVRLRVRSRTLSTTLNFGVMDRLDVGVTLPMVSTTLEARVDKRILRLGTAADPTIHSFDGRGAATATSAGGGSDSGVGDIRMQAKYNVVNKPAWALSGLWDVRLPTGDEFNLLGTGTLFTRVQGLVSAGNRVFSAHANGGMQFAGGGDATDFIGEPGDEILYAFGVDWSVVPRATLNVDFLGRQGAYGNDYFSSQPTDRSLRYVTSVGGPVGTTVVREFQQVGVGTGLEMKAVIGGKVSPWRTLLVGANVLLPVSQSGLRNKPALSLAVEYTF